MKEDNISRLGDTDAPFCEQQYTHGSCYIPLFKFKSFDQFNTPLTAYNFRHLLSCGAIVFSFVVATSHDKFPFVIIDIINKGNEVCFLTLNIEKRRNEFYWYLDDT